MKKRIFDFIKSLAKTEIIVILLVSVFLLAIVAFAFCNIPTATTPTTTTPTTTTPTTTTPTTTIIKTVDESCIRIWTDPETNVQYIIYREKIGYSGQGGITPRLNQDGTLYIVPSEKERK